ncbi:MAG: cyclomaltodextrinase N-terminal domain-containing protein, partial [Comamonadaceae bacterium]
MKSPVRKRLYPAFFLFLCFAFNAHAASYNIQHLEPPSWWVGMKQGTLQLMVHGEQIADLTPSLT